MERAPGDSAFSPLAARLDGTGGLARRERSRRWLSSLLLLVSVPAGLALARPVGGDDRAEILRHIAAAPAPAPVRRTPAAGAATWPRPDPPMVTLAATGDIALGAHVVSSADRPGGLFAGVRDHLRADIVLGNLEGTIARGGVSKCGAAPSASCFAFRTPPASASGLARSGFTLLNVANNHAYDFGGEGQAETLDSLARVRLGTTGRPGQIAFERAGPLTVALVGFAPYRWAQSLLDIPAAVALVRRAAARADIVVATMHQGPEGTAFTHVTPGKKSYLGEDRGNPVAFAHAVVAAGADLVVGHGPHVLQGMEWYHGRLIAYSLGNFAGDRTVSVAGLLGVSGVLQVTLGPDGSWVEGRLLPVRLAGAGTPVPDGRREALRVVRALSRQDFGTRAVGVSGGGSLLPPRAKATVRRPIARDQVAAVSPSGGA